MGNLFESLEDYFENTPKEILDNDWKEIEYLNEIDPSIINIINQYTTPTKDQQAQEYAEKRVKAQLPNSTYSMEYNKRVQTFDSYDIEQAFEDGYTACEQSMWHSVEEEEPQRIDYWTATDPDGRQCTFRSKPLRRQWAIGWCWKPSAGGAWIGEEGTTVLMELLGLPKLTWDDEPYKFTILKPIPNSR